jgi:30S ribosomal protein S31
LNNFSDYKIILLWLSFLTIFTARPNIHKTIYIMGKGDKKTRRGKIILGSFGVRRPKSSKNKAILNVKASAEKAPAKVKKAPAAKAEAKPKVKVAEVVEVAEVAVASAEETAVAAAPKPVKKPVKKAKADDTVKE